MKVSQLGLTNVKLKEIDDQFPVQDVLLKTGQLEQYSSGLYAYGHIPYLVRLKIDNVIRDVLTEFGAAEINLPVLQPEEIWKESGRFDSYVEDNVMFRTIEKQGNYVLAPTAEEAVVKYADRRLHSYRDLPVNYFQNGLKFRNELRARGFLLRGKMFDMLDAYSFGKNKKQLDEEYLNMRNAFTEIFKRLELDVIPTTADSGAIGGSKSEEFMLVSDIGEDTIYFDKDGNVFNEELIELNEDYKDVDTSKLTAKRAVELAHIFSLGNMYSKSMNATFKDENDKDAYFEMGCYGIGVSRTLAVIYEESVIKKDDKFMGISLPYNLAPYKAYIVPMLDDKEKSEIALKYYNLLKDSGIKVLYDDRKHLRVGPKIKDAFITGAPYLIVFGKTLEEGYVYVEETKTGEKTQVKLDELVNYFK